MPKFNLYQSLHTTVLGPDRKPLEVQIRTKEMHDRAEQGIAAHWRYKEGGTTAEDLTMPGDLAEGADDYESPAEFLAGLKLDLYDDEVFALTPNGHVKAAAAGSDADRLRLCGAHRGGASLHRGPGQRPPGAAVHPPRVGGHRRGDHLEGGRPVARLALVRAHLPRRRQDPALVHPGAPRAVAHRGPGGDRQAAAPRRPRAWAPPSATRCSPRSPTRSGFRDVESMFVAIGDGNTNPQTVVNRLVRLVRPESERERG